jgi:muconolactone delta-isomerase
MRYLVVTKGNFPMSPEVAVGALGAMAKWAEKHSAEGKIEQTWSFAGLAAGGGILNVDSPEELDEIMAGFPLAPFSDVQIFGLVDLHKSLDHSVRAAAGAAAAMAAMASQ